MPFRPRRHPWLACTHRARCAAQLAPLSCGEQFRQPGEIARGAAGQCLANSALARGHERRNQPARFKLSCVCPRRSRLPAQSCSTPDFVDDPSPASHSCMLAGEGARLAQAGPRQPVNALGCPSAGDLLCAEPASLLQPRQHRIERAFAERPALRRADVEDTQRAIGAQELYQNAERRCFRPRSPPSFAPKLHLAHLLLCRTLTRQENRIRPGMTPLDTGLCNQYCRSNLCCCDNISIHLKI
jgi:hypothetical protein